MGFLPTQAEGAAKKLADSTPELACMGQTGQKRLGFAALVVIISRFRAL